MNNFINMSQSSLDEAFNTYLYLWNDADRDGNVQLAKYYDDRMEEIDEVLKSRFQEDSNNG